VIQTARPVRTSAAAVPVDFAEYVAARGHALVRFANLLTGDAHLAEDLVQDALARLYLRWSRIGRSDHLDLYVRKVVVNAYRSWWRRPTNQERPAADPGLDRAEPVRHDTEAAERDAMWRLIQDLPRRQRAVIVLRYYEDLDDASIAEILDCSAVTVRTHAMRALHTLRSRHTHPSGDSHD
jgi:RNA polymerase sigma-70 factor (sigma-E family)